MRFYLGTHETGWLQRPAVNSVPLFISDRRLKRRKTLPIAVTDWALDSGGFTELAQFGGWQTTAAEYTTRVTRYRDEIGRLQWVAPQDWMCEPFMLANTGLTIMEHQTRTIDNFRELRQTLGLLVVPVLQGWERSDYLRHWEAYDRAGVDLEAEATVGLGSVCRRQATGQAEAIVWSLQPLRLHGFGMKTDGLRRYGAGLQSSDSMAWSFQARKRPPLEGHTHKTCSNCIDYAMLWRRRSLAPPRKPQLWGA